ncbi:MAG: putative flagellar motor switch protein FliN [Candidatus Scalindua rubra]|uniref:Flagellar motor switch protein FliN n=1 Tax=Candidatus Scalindua rubra TaxID=1872076 RepID=A0A1E3X6U6_9BACT|nr:MAG: putative flagellar motor switch protein FliN [Candidatus Scalindua rubra]
MENKTTEDQKMSTQDIGNKEAIKSVEFSALEPVQSKPGERNMSNIDMLMDIKIPVIVELGQTEMLMRDILALSPGAIIELDSLAGEPVKVTVRGKTIAHGEVVVVDENFGVKITMLIDPQDKIKGMG